VDASEDRRPLRVLAIYGNPKPGGFVHGCVDHVATRLEGKGAEVDRLRLSECDIRDCLGCFHCLRTGNCSTADDMEGIIRRVRLADGLVVGASVRNGFAPALLKRFYERITYILGFGRELHGKYVLAVGAVGLAGGRRTLGKQLTFREFQTFVSDYLFFRTGIPTKRSVEDVAAVLDRTADRLHRAMSAGRPLSWSTRVFARFDDFVLRKFMLEPNPDGVYDYVVSQWKKKGLM